MIVNGAADAGAAAERAAELQAEYGVPAIGIRADISNGDEVKELFSQVHRQFKRLDVLVNNAGIMRDSLLGMIGYDLLQGVHATNVFGTIMCMQYAARLMARHKCGSIVNMASIVGCRGNEGQTAYAASKAAVVGATLAAAKELAPLNVRVNAIAPGFIDTEMTQRLPADKRQKLVESIGMGRIGQPDDIARVALFLASDLSAYVTGQVIGVDGGMVL